MSKDSETDLFHICNTYSSVAEPLNLETAPDSDIVVPAKILKKSTDVASKKTELGKRSFLIVLAYTYF
jgi:hypothetical protein